MFQAVAHIEGISPLIFSRRIDEPKKPGETEDDRERRVFREKAHTNADGQVIVPAVNWQRMLATTAQLLSRKIPGKGNSTYTKVFKTGVMCDGDMVLDLTAADLKPRTILCNSQGNKGGAGGSQVPRVFPEVPRWGGTVTFCVLTDSLPEEVFREHLVKAGVLNGILSFRPQNGGTNGRFRVAKMEWSPWSL